MKFTLTTFVLLCSLFAYAQEKISYLDTSGKPVKEKDAVLLEQRVKHNDTCWEVNRYSLYGPRISSIQFMDEEGRQMHGRYIVYSPSGYADTVCEYVHGVRKGRRTSNDDSLKKAGIETKDSRFPGGASLWMRYINNHVTYPKRAFKQAIQGTPVVYFMIERDGYIYPWNAYLERSVEYAIDKEALRVICASPRWIVGTIDHQPVRTFKKQEIVFKLSPI